MSFNDLRLRTFQLRIRNQKFLQLIKRYEKTYTEHATTMESQQRQNQQIQQAPQRVEVSAKLFSAKYNSKRECYNFLAVDVGV